MFKLDLEKAEEPEIKLPTSIGSLKKQDSSKKNIYFCFIDYAKAFDCVDHNKPWKILKEIGIPDRLTCFLRNLLMKVKVESEKVGLKLNIQKTIMASSPITSWEIDGETVDTVSDFIFLGSKITADGDCSHEIKRRLLLGSKVMTNLDSISKSRGITLPTKVRLVKAMVFPVVMYGCESWTVKKAECRRIDAFELWCRRSLLKVP